MKHIIIPSVDKKREKILLVGNYGKKNQRIANGQSVKTNVITKELENHYGKNNCIQVDTSPSNKIEVIIKFIINYNKCSTIIIMPAENALRIIAPLCTLLNVFKKKRLFYIVIGGWLPDFLNEHHFIKYILTQFDCVFVETNGMKDKLNKIGVKFIEIIPNCKQLNILTTSEIENINRIQRQTQHKRVTLCTFSRVCKEKGIELAIKAVEELNEELDEPAYYLDIYGQIDEDQKEWFLLLQSTFPIYIKYKGIVDYEKTSIVLKNYSALLFPTYYSGEGFPGTLIDAMAVGLPIIASDWKYNKEIIKNGKNGYLFQLDNLIELKATIRSIYLENDKWMDMRFTVLKGVNAYLPNNAISPLYMKVDRK